MKTMLAFSAPRDVSTPSPAAAPAMVPEAWDFGEFRVLAGLDLLFRGDDVVPLEPRAVCVLRHLVRHAGRVVGKEELLDEVWPDTFVTDSVLKKAVSLIRRALDDPPQHSRFIETFHRRGYRFITPVQSAAAAAPPALAPVERDERDLDFDQLAGRETEMEALRAEYRRALTGQATALLVLGDAGIGKTQLSRHFQAWAGRQGALCLYTRFFDYGGSRVAPAALFLDLLRTALGTERPEELRAAIEARLRVALPAELFAASHGFAPAEPLALSSSEAAALSSQTACAIASCFVALSRRTPLVLQLDDLQWADPFALEVGTHLLRACRGERLLLVALARPAEQLAAWRRTQAGLRGLCEVPLRGLGDQGFRQALAAVLGHAGGEPDLTEDTIAEEDLRRLHRLTEGNPYFLTEVLRGLAADGVVRRTLGGRWRCDRLRCLRLPETLATAARSLLQTLDPEVREILESAAVLGDEVRVPLLALVADRTTAEIEQLLARALLAGAVSMAQLSPGEDCRFRHAILRQVLYDDLSPWRRRALHAQGARALEQLFADEPGRVSQALAAHHRAAGELQRSFAWDLRAAQAALGRWQWREALAGAERAREDATALRRAGATGPAPGDLIELRIVLGRCLSVLGQAREAEVELDAAATAAVALRDDSTLAHAFFHLAQARVAQGRQAEARAASERALALFSAQADERAAALVRSQLASIRIAMGEYAAATEALRNEGGDQQPVLGVSLSGTRGWALALQSRYAEAIPLLEIAATERRGEDDARGLAGVLRRLQWAYLGRGEHVRALAISAEAGACFRTTGDLLGLARTGMSIGQALVAQGLAAKGLDKLRRAAEELRGLGDLHCEAEALWLAGRALVDLGRLDEARPLLESSLATVRQVPDRDDEFRISIDVARLLRAEGRPQEALDTARSAHAIALGLGSRDGAAWALVEAAFAHLALDARGEALAVAEEAVDLLTRIGSGELWRGLWALGLAQETWSLRLSIATLERCESLLATARAPIGSPGDRRAVEEARRAPVADLHRLLLAAGETARVRELHARWPVALG
jgi:DNA-binding winged helix-turn-helix (wHTH) protein/tetratricopeptide (TPR) repeat protein